MPGILHQIQDAAATELALLLDVDLLPSPGLHAQLTSSARYSALAQHCVRQKTVFVLPAFEVLEDSAARDAPPAPTDGEDALGLDFEDLAEGIRAATREGRRAGVGQVAMSQQQVADVTEAVLRLHAKGAEAVAAALSNGAAVPFHTRHYPAGHAATNASAWARAVSSTGSAGIAGWQALRGDGPTDGGQWGSYPVHHAEGYEPFLVAAPGAIPRFDERFRGYGYDKVSHTLTLALHGWSFRVLTPAFCLDVPHQPSADRLVTLGEAADWQQRLRVAALYRRVELEQQLRAAGQLPGAQCARTAEPTAAGLEGASSVSAALAGLRCLLWRDQLQVEAASAPGPWEEALWPPAADIEAPRAGQGREPAPHAAQPQLRATMWAAQGWRMAARRGLHNCRLCSDGGGGDASVLVHLPRGSWSPDATFERLGIIGGVAARTLLDTPGANDGDIGAAALRHVLLQYDLAFPPGFQWALGGALPGLYCTSGLRVSFCWREGGSGHVVLSRPGEGSTLLRAQPEGGGSAPGWSFLRGAGRHTMSLELRAAEGGRWSVRAWADGRLVVVGEAGPVAAAAAVDAAASPGGIALPKYSAPSSYATGGKAHQQDGEELPTDSAARQDTIGGRQAVEDRVAGLLLTCFYGGSTPDWAAPATTAVQLARFRVHCAMQTRQ
mmetsp:Transcript_24976/g.64814  ORF Transcript_24976/g.64814 Transcript_24976/m.64814 type:complete len:667 (+) Transcript_24976:1788-3788(+)